MPTQTPDPGPALERGALATLAEQLAAWFAARVHSHALAAGARLPSVREAARRHHVAPTTVVAAYDLLQAQGLVEARAQRGFFVRDIEPRASARIARPTRGTTPPPLSATTLVRSMFERGIDGAGDCAPSPGASPGPSPGIGTLPADWLDLPLLHSALRRALAEDQKDPASLRYGAPAGDARLRGALVHRLRDLGIGADAQQIVTTGGATAALELVSQLLLAPGDSALVDEPGWPVDHARLTRMGVKLLPVPRAADGPDRAALRQWLQARRAAGENKPRVYFTASVLHNPTGGSMTLAAAHEVLKLAEAHDLTLIEDDTYAWLAPPGSPRLSALDQLQRTVYIGGFAKIFTPNWRVGFLAAAPALVERAIERKLLGALATPGLTERAVAIALEQGALRRHAERVTQRLAAARARSVRLAQDAGFAFAAPPNGLFGWIDTGVDTDRLATLMHGDGWLLAPGSLFHVAGRPSPLMRINFAAAQDARLWRALAKGRDACREPNSDRAHVPVKRGAVAKRNEAYHRAAPLASP
jgi:DNA-binding transcriptional MocR family regulator